MAIYDADGNQLFSCYDSDGNSLNYAYDAEGNIIFQKEEPPTPVGIPLRVMSYNVGQWYYGSGDNVPASQDAEYYALQNGMIQNANADIACFCEYMNDISKLPRTAQSMLSQYYQYILSQGGGGGYLGRAICSKYLMENWTHHSFSNESSRYYDSATVTVDDIPITVIVTHLNYANESLRLGQLNELIAYFKTLDRFICCGDFNTLDCKSTSGANYANMIVPLLNEGFHLANCSSNGFKVTYSDEPTSTWDGCLDNIITSSNIYIDSVHVDTTKLSDNLTERTDHMPLIADLVVLTES
jgi:endonuclease/exonuclease/phosphatase family metal-dependent hydrolase